MGLRVFGICHFGVLCALGVSVLRVQRFLRAGLST